MDFPRSMALVAALVIWGPLVHAQGEQTSDAVEVSDPLEALAEAGNMVTQVSAGRDHTCALVQSRQVYCWGSSTYGQLGRGSNTNSSVPLRVRNLSNVQQIAAGEYHTCARTTGGWVYCWGRNQAGQLGDGTQTDRWTRVRVRPARNITYISAGGYNSCMVNSNGRASCWGDNQYGQVGNGSTGSWYGTPQRLNSGIRFTRLATGYRHSCGVARNRRGYCWGEGVYYKLGTGNSSNQNTPQRVLSLVRLIDITAGDNHSCAVRNDGVPYCWGENSSGQLGDGTNQRRPAPTRVIQLFNLQSIDAYASQTCGVRQSGKAVCWGDNTWGQLGNGDSLTSSSVRQTVRRLSGVQTVTSGRAYSCASTSSGRGYCWGRNTFGQLGNGVTSFGQTPIRQRVRRLGN